MKELSVFSVLYFDVMDIVVENTAGPLMLCGMKGLSGASPTVHYTTVCLSLVSDMNIHSLNPYTLSFWNPLFDSML
jgi:hypothetical protein